MSLLTYIPTSLLEICTRKTHLCLDMTVKGMDHGFIKEEDRILMNCKVATVNKREKSFLKTGMKSVEVTANNPICTIA